MKFNKNTFIIILVIGVLAIAGILFGISKFTIIGGSFQTQSACRAYVSGTWCPEGYACSDCSLYTLPYYIYISGTSGPTTNKIYTADCVAGSSNTGVGATGTPRTYCSAGGGGTCITHNGWWCSDNDLYYYDSCGNKETKKTECVVGCTSIYSGATTKVSCDATKCDGRNAYINGAWVTNYCASGTHCAASSNSYSCVSDTVSPVPETYCVDTHYLCKTGLRAFACQGGTQQFCSYGCEDDACKSAPSCSGNLCSSNGVNDCTSATTFRTCNYDANNCLIWSEPKTCANGLECSGGYCSQTVYSGNYPVCAANGQKLCISNAKTFNGEIVSCSGTTCVAGCLNGVCVEEPPSCTPTSVCLTAKTIEITAGDCTKSTISCTNTEECVDATCKPITIIPPGEMCRNVVCNDYCDASKTYLSSGTCDTTTGKCKYSSVVVNSKNCISGGEDCTEDSYGLDSCGTGEEVLKGKCIDGKIQMVAQPSCNKTFLEQYGMWLIGGISLIIAIVGIMFFGGKRK